MEIGSIAGIGGVGAPAVGPRDAKAARGREPQAERERVPAPEQTAGPEPSDRRAPPDGGDFRRFRLTFRLDEDLNRVVVQVIDPETKQVVRSIPAEELIATLRRLRETSGAFVDDEA